MSNDSKVGTILDGKYELIRVIGKGGMGTVYEARHRLINRRLAVKLLHPEYSADDVVVRRFQREARASAAIGHEHIIDITDMGVTETGELFIVMEFLRGCDLNHLLEKEGRLSPARACHILIQVLSALEASHAAGIVHRDLKPANIFLMRHRNTEDYAKLVDFGISKVRTSDDDVTQGLTRNGVLLGTPSYMSPEQVRGEADITSATDIYAVGVVLYEMLTGKLPFADSIPMLLVRILNEEPADPHTLRPDLPVPLTNAMKSAMAKDASQRFPDAASFRRVLTEFSPTTEILTGLASTGMSMKAADLAEELSGDWTNPRGIQTSDSCGLTPLTTEFSEPRKQNRRAILWGLVGLAIVIPVIGIPIALKQEDQTQEIESSTAQDPDSVVGQHPRKTPEKAPNLTTPPEQTTRKKPQIGYANKDTVHLQASTTPSYAKVYLDGIKIATGTLDTEVPVDDAKHEIVVKAPGFRDHKEQIYLKTAVKLRIELKRADGHRRRSAARSSQIERTSIPSKETKPKKPSSTQKELGEKPEKKTALPNKDRIIDEKIVW